FNLVHLGLAPAPGHAGFDKVVVGEGRAVDTHCYAHYLHHKYFECNTISGGSVRRGRLRPPVEVDPSLVEVRRGVEGDAALGDRTVEVLDRTEVLVGERLAGHRPG